VKTRAAGSTAHPEQFVHDAKQRRLTRLGLAFLKSRRLLDRPARFDVVAITWLDDRREPHLEHFPGAFDAVGPRGFFS
jgi:putative endonuclease